VLDTKLLSVTLGLAVSVAATSNSVTIIIILSDSITICSN